MELNYGQLLLVRVKEVTGEKNFSFMLRRDEAAGLSASELQIEEQVWDVCDLTETGLLEIHLPVRPTASHFNAPAPAAPQSSAHASSVAHVNDTKPLTKYSKLSETNSIRPFIEIQLAKLYISANRGAFCGEKSFSRVAVDCGADDACADV
jgi:hypothetical protein